MPLLATQSVFPLNKIDDPRPQRQKIFTCFLLYVFTVLVIVFVGVSIVLKRRRVRGGSVLSCFVFSSL